MSDRKLGTNPRAMGTNPKRLGEALERLVRAAETGDRLEAALFDARARLDWKKGQIGDEQ